MPDEQHDMGDKASPTTVLKALARYLAWGLWVSPLTLALAFFSGLEGLGAVLYFVLLSLGAGFVIRGIAHSVQLVGERGVLRFIAISGESTPSVPQYSLEQSLVERGQVAEALAMYESRIARSAGDADVRLRAAELYATSGNNPRRAAELFAEVRRIDGVGSGQDIYASNRLIDLYSGALDMPGRALVELRRMIDRYPGTPAAANARNALARLKRGSSVTE